MFTHLYLLLLQPSAGPDFDNLPARQVFAAPDARGRAWLEVARIRAAAAAARGRAWADTERGRTFTVQARARAWLAEDLA